MGFQSHVRRARGRAAAFFLDWSFEHQFNSRLQIKLQYWKFAYRCGLLLHNCSSNKRGPCVTFSGIKKDFLIHLRLSTFVYTCLMTRLHSSTLAYWLFYSCLNLSTFVCDLFLFVYTRLHSSSDSSVFLESIPDNNLISVYSSYTTENFKGIP